MLNRIVYDRKNHQTIAIGVYHGKTVKAYAHQHPQDIFDEETGRNLAISKLNHKIALKRVRAAEDRLRKLRAERMALSEQLTKLDRKIISSITALDKAHITYDQATEELKEVLSRS